MKSLRRAVGALLYTGSPLGARPRRCKSSLARLPIGGSPRFGGCAEAGGITAAVLQVDSSRAAQAARRKSTTRSSKSCGGGSRSCDERSPCRDGTRAYSTRTDECHGPPGLRRECHIEVPRRPRTCGVREGRSVQRYGHLCDRDTTSVANYAAKLWRHGRGRGSLRERRSRLPVRSGRHKSTGSHGGTARPPD